MTRAVTDDHLWRRGAAEKLHYAPHSLIGRAMLGVSREVCCSAGLCAWPLQHESYLILKSWFCRSSSSGADACHLCAHKGATKRKRNEMIFWERAGRNRLISQRFDFRVRNVGPNSSLRSHLCVKFPESLRHE